MKNLFFPAGAQPLFSFSDAEGFFGLMVDNLVQYLLIVVLLTGLVGLQREFIISSVLPAVAISLIIGNLYYAWLAQRLSAATGRKDVTALPYGVNTISVFAFIFLAMIPAKLAAQSQGATPQEAALVAWRVGVAACFLSGIIELAGSFVAERIRKATPRAALLTSLAGIAVAFLCMDFAARCFAYPLVALLPFGVLLFTLLSRTRLPLGIPGVGLALVLGMFAAWVLFAAGFGEETSVSGPAVSKAFGDVGFYLPIPVLGDLVAGLSDPLVRSILIPVVLPMGLYNILGSLQNIESAEAAGDPYPTGPCLAVNGVGSIAASLFGSCFPTTIYIGHPGWKEMGAKGGYSVMNGAFYAVVSLVGLSSLAVALVPVEAAGVILIWVGLVMTAQAFQTTPRSHAPAVALGLVPSLAAWGTIVVSQTVGAVGAAISDGSVAHRAFENLDVFVASGLQLPGLVALSQGFMLSSVVWAATAVCLVERRLTQAGVWMGAGAVMAFFGFIHAGEISVEGSLYSLGFATGARWAAGYALAAVFFLVVSHVNRRSGGETIR
ncbi:MAG: NCS2 family permease [Candidatus Dadabacteria bacterium]|nr:NCS2 family permease [Candidatus Dadabacteria bacterium]MYA47980.1 NCS2 family permease [Candidatus Dadabacteria bacterium]MYF48153.1 NCS2 family permease [Candidatus Dadabacteria bacterium]MYG82652.1 NCS2 family permease [Candidatus Dadabacteria bacterium]MYK49150.1 NCS2 family permease [Candidatus Dadabacteria bacterium]